jgi:hypothetical protein
MELLMASIIETQVSCFPLLLLKFPWVYFGFLVLRERYMLELDTS